MEQQYAAFQPSSKATTEPVRSFSTNSRPALRAAACGGRPRPATTRREPGHRPHHHRSRHQYRTLLDTSSSPDFGHAKEKGPDCRQQRRDLAGVVGASVSGRQRRLERRLPRRLWRSRRARRFPMAEPACWAISSRKARSGSHRISNRHPASSHHKDRVHTLAPRPTRYRLQRGNRGNEKAPRMRETLRVGGPCWAHSDDYMPERDDRSSHGQVGRSAAVYLSAVARGIGQSGH